ncbi:MAG TPA: DUF892 family protein [Alphaproteobacteria bacterium]|nr:DUF892 family protein [Alphaproteobacteria bacterium]
MSSIKNLNDLFVGQLRDIYYAEKKILSVIKTMSKKCKDTNLQKAFEKDISDTENQINVLEEVMTSLDLQVKGEKCEAIEGLVKEAEELIKDVEDPEAMDASLILAIQKIKHYEIATYGCLCAFGNRLGYEIQSQKMHKVLEQQKKSDVELTRLAEGPTALNKKAMAS